MFKPDIDKLRTRQDVAGLIKALRYKQPEIRRDAARALGWLKTPSALVPLVTASQDADVAVRREAVLALASLALGSEQLEIRQRVARALAAASQDADVAVRRHAVGYVGRLGDPGGVEPLARVLLHDPDEDTRWSAALGMFWMRHAEGAARDKAVTALIAALGDSSAKVREKSAEVLGSLPDPRSIEPLTQVRTRGGGAASLKKLAAAYPDAVIEQMLRALTSKDPDVRQCAVSVLGSVGDRRAVKPLINALQDTAQAVRVAAATGLGKLGDPEAVDALMAAYYGSRPSSFGWGLPFTLGAPADFAKVTYSALAAIADPRTTDIFLEEFDRDPPSVFRPHESLAVKTLKRIPGPKAETAVRLAEALMCVASEDPEKRALAISELRQLGDAGVRPLARELIALSTWYANPGRGEITEEYWNRTSHTIDRIREALQAIASPAAERALSDASAAAKAARAQSQSSPTSRDSRSTAKDHERALRAGPEAAHKARVDAMYATQEQRWRARHVPASEEYKAVHRDRPTD